jgi:hypothetical protein
MNNNQIAAEAAEEIDREVFEYHSGKSELHAIELIVQKHIEKALTQPQWIGEPTAAELERHKSRTAHASEDGIATFRRCWPKVHKAIRSDIMVAEAAEEIHELAQLYAAAHASEPKDPHQIAAEAASKAFLDNESYVQKRDTWRMPPQLPLTEEHLTDIIQAAIEKAIQTWLYEKGWQGQTFTPAHAIENEPPCLTNGLPDLDKQRGASS